MKGGRICKAYPISKMNKKTKKMLLAVMLVLSMIIPLTAPANYAYAQNEVVANKETATITPVENDYTGNIDKNIFSNAHFKVACSSPFSKITINGYELALTPNKWTDINLSNVKAYLNEGASNKIEVWFEDDTNVAYVGGVYEFIYDTTAPTLTLANTNPNKYVIELGNKYFEDYTVSDNVSKSEDINVEIIYRYNDNGNYQQVDGLDKIGNYTVWYKISDEAGNTVTKAATREIDVVDTTAPKLYPSQANGTEVDGVIYHSDVNFKLYDLGGLSYLLINDRTKVNRSGVWNDANYINMKNYYLPYQMNTIDLYDLSGNKTEYSFVYDIEKPILDVQYSTTAPTNQDVTVTIKALNESYNGYGGISAIDGWTKVDNQTYQKVFNDNTSIKDLAVSDFAGNVSYIDIDVNNIDREFGKTTLTYSVDKGEYTNGNVTVTLKCTEEIVTPEGWTKNTYSNGKVNYTKEYSENGTDEFKIYDLAGNEKTIVVTIDQIDRNVPVINGIENGKNYNKEINYTIDEDHLDYVLINNIKYYGNDIPYTISDEGTYTIKAVDTAGNQSQEYTFIIDKTKPVVTLLDANGNVVKNKDIINIEVNSDFDLDKAISGSASDSVDGTLPVTRGTFIRYGSTTSEANGGVNAGKVDVSKLGYYLVKYQAKDKAGNLTTVSVYFHVIDTTKPTVEMSYNGQSLKSGDMIQVEAGSDFTLKDIQVVSTDNGVISNEGWSEKTIRYSQNLEDVGTAGFSAIDTNKQGYYLAKYVASDSALDSEGNAKPNSRYVGIYIHVIDTVKPVINGIENNKAYNKDVTYTIDEKFLDYVVINETKYYGEDIPYTISEEGTYTIKAVDTAGNESEEYQFKIDKKLPEYNPEQWFITVEVDANASNPYLNSEQVAKIIEEQKQYISDENEVTVVEDTWWNHNESTLDIRKIGTYANSFSFYITDEAGNRINPRITVKVVDTTAPVIDLGTVAPVSDHEYMTPFVDITPVVTDNSGEVINATVSRVVYATSQADLETSTEYLAAVDANRLGWYKIEYSATDSSGNTAIASRIVHVVDTTKPTYTIEYSTTDYTYDSVTVTIKTNEYVEISGDGWVADETGTVFTKVFTKNTSEEVILSDASNNSTNLVVKIDNIVDKSSLEVFVNKCSTLDSTKYSEASWNNFYPVYLDAVEMLSHPQSQEVVDKMYEDLIRAYLDLRLIPDAGLIK